MLPNPDHLPALGTQHPSNSFVSFSIFLNLVQPKRPVSRGNGTTALTTMPETAVQKNREASSCEYNIRASRQAGVMTELPASDTGAHQK